MIKEWSPTTPKNSYQVKCRNVSKKYIILFNSLAYVFLWQSWGSSVVHVHLCAWVAGLPHSPQCFFAHGCFQVALRERESTRNWWLCGVVTVSSPPFLLFLLSPHMSTGRARTLSILYFPIACSNINNTPSNIHFKFFAKNSEETTNVIRDLIEKRKIRKEGNVVTGLDCGRWETIRAVWYKWD